MRLVVSAKCPPMAASEISAPPAPRAVKQPSVPVTGDPQEIQWQKRRKTVGQISEIHRIPGWGKPNLLLLAAFFDAFFIVNIMVPDLYLWSVGGSLSAI